MTWLRRFMNRIYRQIGWGDPKNTPLPILVHAHDKEKVPPGELEDGMIAVEQDGLVLHALAEIVRPDGTFCDLDEDRIEWASRLSYRHLKREGCLEAYGVPVIPAFEGDKSR